MSITKSNCLSALSKIKKELLSFPNVNFIGVGEKYTKGKGQKKYSIKIGVTNKIKNLYKSELVPKTYNITINGKELIVETDVVIAPKLYKVFALSGGDKIVGLWQGVCGVTYISEENEHYAITNNHVVSDWGNLNFGSNVTDGNGNKIGEATRITPVSLENVNEHDAALIRLNIKHIPFWFNTAEVTASGIGNFNTNSDGAYFYCVEDNVIEVIVSTFITTPVQIMTETQVAEFTNIWLLEVSSGQAIPGHSGSVILKNIGGKIKICGVLFAGNESSNQILVMPIISTLNRLGLPKASFDGFKENVNFHFI